MLQKQIGHPAAASGLRRATCWCEFAEWRIFSGGGVIASSGWRHSQARPDCLACPERRIKDLDRCMQRMQPMRLSSIWISGSSGTNAESVWHSPAILPFAVRPSGDGIRTGDAFEPGPVTAGTAPPHRCGDSRDTAACFAAATLPRTPFAPSPRTAPPGPTSPHASAKGSPDF